MASRLSAALLLLHASAAAAGFACSSLALYEYVEQIVGTTRHIQTSLCPNHPTFDVTPTYAAGAFGTVYRVPERPMRSMVGQTGLETVGGPVGIARSGVMVYSAFAGTSPLTDYGSSATFLEGDTYDHCGGHSSSNDGTPSYHYHGPPSCLLEQLGMANGAHAPQIGWMADGARRRRPSLRPQPPPTSPLARRLPAVRAARAERHGDARVRARRDRAVHRRVRGVRGRDWRRVSVPILHAGLVQLWRVLHGADGRGQLWRRGVLPLHTALPARLLPRRRRR